MFCVYLHSKNSPDALFKFAQLSLFFYLSFILSQRSGRSWLPGWTPWTLLGESGYAHKFTWKHGQLNSCHSFPFFQNTVFIFPDDTCSLFISLAVSLTCEDFFAIAEEKRKGGKCFCSRSNNEMSSVCFFHIQFPGNFSAIICYLKRAEVQRNSSNSLHPKLVDGEWRPHAVNLGTQNSAHSAYPPPRQGLTFWLQILDGLIWSHTRCDRVRAIVWHNHSQVA